MKTSYDSLYLREDVYFEPLLNHWYVWPYLIPPVTCARHIVNTHKRIMNSFVNNYKLHILAVNQPGMAGAEFLNCNEEQVSEIKKLVDEINSQHTDLVELSVAVQELDELLRNHKSAETIEYLYKEIPNPLKGFVELFMDMENNPSYRLLESLLYKSSFYKTSLQTISWGLLSRSKERPFVLSTPRLPDENHLHLKIDYNCPLLDEVFRSREIPISFDRIKELFSEHENLGGLFYMDLFTTKPPKYKYKPVESGVRIQYIGHAGFLIESPDTVILVDPVIASSTEDNIDDIISFSQLPPKIDYICLTHNHQDHINIESLLQLRYKTNKIFVPKNNGGTLADPSIRLILKQFNFNVEEVEDMEDFPLENGRIVSVPFLGEHGDLNIRSKTAWFFDILNKKIFIGADSSNLDPNMYRHIKNQIGEVDILAIGMECVGAPYTWIYGALYTKPVAKKTKESRRLNGSDYEQAINIAEMLKPSSVLLYALGMESWYKYFMGIDYEENSRQIVETKKMLEACKERNIFAECLYGKKTIILN